MGPRDGARCDRHIWGKGYRHTWGMSMNVTFKANI